MLIFMIFVCQMSQVNTHSPLFLTLYLCNLSAEHLTVFMFLCFSVYFSWITSTPDTFWLWSKRGNYSICSFFRNHSNISFMINIFVTNQCPGDIFHPTNNYAFVNPDSDTNPEHLPIITLNGNYTNFMSWNRRNIILYYIRK